MGEKPHLVTIRELSMPLHWSLLPSSRSVIGAVQNEKLLGPPRVLVEPAAGRTAESRTPPPQPPKKKSPMSNVTWEGAQQDCL